VLDGGQEVARGGVTSPRDETGKPSLAEPGPAVGPGIRNAVRICDQRLARPEGRATHAEGQPRQQPQGGPRRRQGRPDPARARDQRRIVAGVNVAEGARRRIQEPEEQGGEHVGIAVDSGDVVVHEQRRARQRGGIGPGVPVAEALHGGGAQERSAEGHEERGAQPLVADVGHHQGQHAAFRQGEYVVEVAGHLTRRAEPGGDVPARGDGHLPRQESLLDGPPRQELPLQAPGMSLLQVAETLLLEAGANPGVQQDRVEGFGQVVLGAQLDATDDAVGVVQGRDHDYRDVSERRVILHALQDLVAVEPRHHDVQEHQVVRPVATQHGQGLLPVGRHIDLVPQPPQPSGEHVPVHLLVVHDQDPAGGAGDLPLHGHVSGHGPPPPRAGSPAVRRPRSARPAASAGRATVLPWPAPPARSRTGSGRYRTARRGPRSPGARG
jgi:hypothetical protein